MTPQSIAIILRYNTGEFHYVLGLDHESPPMTPQSIAIILRYNIGEFHYTLCNVVPCQS